jgi:tetratricopeptide (TPR) repeat protein
MIVVRYVQPSTLSPACACTLAHALTHTVIVRNKTFPNGGRLRVNMGNIYFEQKKYSTAIKMYRMALDQIPATSKEVCSQGRQDMSYTVTFRHACMT